MCERVVIPEQAEVEREISVTHRWWTFTTRFNVAFSQSVPVVRMHEGESEGVMMRWGLVPSSTKPEHAGPGVPCIGSEEVEAVKDYRAGWMAGQRCIVPLAGFYVWRRAQAGHRQPHYVRLVNRPVFGVAGLWDRFVAEGDDVIDGCALITVASNGLFGESNPSKQPMPAILHREDYKTWLSGRPAEAKRLLQTYPRDAMLTHAVGPHVNFLKYDNASLIRPIGQRRKSR